MAKTTIRITKKKPGGLSVEPEMALASSAPIQSAESTQTAPKAKYHGWCLFSPKGVPIPPTFGETKEACWGYSYEYLAERDPVMMQLWQKWHESQAYAKEKGFTIRKVWFTWEE